MIISDVSDIVWPVSILHGIFFIDEEEKYPLYICFYQAETFSESLFWTDC